MTFAFGMDLDHIPNRIVQSLKPYLPHLSKSVEIGRTFGQLRMLHGAVFSALDHINIGIMLVLRSGDVILSNREAKRILDGQDGLRLGLNGTLLCDTAEDTAQLTALIAEVAETAAGDADAAHKQMTLPRRAAKRPYLVDIAPVRDSKNELGTSFYGTIVFVIDPLNNDSLNVDQFATMYRLTPAETSVCNLMAKGYSAPEMANIRGTSPATIKNQISAVLSKTETHPRSGLIRLIVQSLPPITYQHVENPLFL